MTLDYRWAIGLVVLLTAIVVSSALLMARVGDLLEAVSDSQDCMIELLLVEPQERTIETVRDACPAGSIPEQDTQ